MDFRNSVSIAALCGVGLVLGAFAQQPVVTPQQLPAAGGGRGGRGPAAGMGGFAAAYPQRPPADPAAAERGRAIYGVNCSFCHGSDARGGEGGPNLLRSQLVLRDEKGELITPVVQNGRPDGGMPKMNLTVEQVADVAAYIHSFRVGGYDVSRNPPPTILVGDAKAGEAYFRSKCASCHSVTGDLKGFGAKFEDPKMLQNTFLMPGGGRGGFGGAFGGAAPPINVPATTVTVTLPSGQKVEGRLGR